MKDKHYFYQTISPIFWWLLSILWMMLIFWLSSIPDLRSGFQPVWDVILRKIAHAIEFGILTFLLFVSGRRSGLSRTKSILFAFLISLLYAASDEYHQKFVVGRHGSVMDWAIDSVGILAASALSFRRM